VAPERPLRGVRVLDLTRILAGPIATRFLAGFGAEVLRIDPPDWDEPGVLPEVTLGKRCATLDLRDPGQRLTLERLLGEADVLVHGYRPGALDRLGFGAERRQQIRPGLVDVSLNAYGWSGPWRARRGFDSLVQMSSGIADAGMRRQHADRPTPLPVQALDHATGYLLAAAVIHGLRRRFETGVGSQVRTSLARMAALLVSQAWDDNAPSLASETPDDLAPDLEATPWGPAVRLTPPVQLEGASMRWDHPASRSGMAAAHWLSD
jgi:crotonobetainyl-CoA:carnitine CoA-transferase CaiB-like acyl-CoA transferase